VSHATHNHQNNQQPAKAGKTPPRCFLLAMLALANPASAEIPIPSVPLNMGQSSPPVVMLVAGKDHKMFYAAYDDRTDLDGDGVIDIRFNPRIVYYGLFDSKLCYSGAVIGRGDTFGPSKPVTDMALRKCSGGLWSGNFLNYVTTSRMDALRRVLYGGERAMDTAEGTVILRRAYIPRDAHGWGKEYTSQAVDGYNIADYTPYSAPTAGRRHFFGNYTLLTNCTTASTCRGAAPVLHVAVNASGRIWDWAGSEGSALFSDTTVGASSNDKYKVQAVACYNTFTLPDGTANYRGENCKPYTSSKGRTLFRPTGVLHKFGEDGSILFGLLTGSYDTNVSGGMLRKAISSFVDEVNQETGQFTANSTIVKTFNNMMIRGFMGRNELNYSNYLNSSYSNWIGNRIMLEREFPDWGNPIGEMMYEALRYLGGAGAPIPEFQTSTTTNDSAVGMPRAAWDKPYSRIPWCSQPNILILSDINPSFDSDQLPGARFRSCSRTGSTANLSTTDACVTSTSTHFTGSFGSLDVGKLVDEIGQKEGINGKAFFIGQSGPLTDWAPTAKIVTSLSSIRGLAPEEPGKEGSYYSAGVACYGKTVGIPTVAGKKNQKVDTWVIALASPLPKIEVTTPRGTITIVPFGKSVSSRDFNIDPARTRFQPATQIVDFFVTNPPSSTGLYDAKFLISFEDMEQGADHDMDVIVEYHVQQQANGDVKVTLTPKYMAASILMNIGYVVSGAGSQDGAYLVVQNIRQLSSTTSYYLNVPDKQPVGYCAQASNSTKAECFTLPSCSNSAFGVCGRGEYSTRIFTPSSTSSAATLLKDPLWYAAKWGGFRDTDANHWPDTPKKWDADGDGQPDTYFSVRNALALEKALTTALSAIREGTDKSSGKIDTSSDTLSSSDTFAFSTTLHVSPNPPDWAGDLVATPITRIDKNNPTGLGQVRWRAAEQLPAANSRNILTRNNSNLQDIPSNSREFRWSELNSDQRDALTFEERFNGSDILDYVRGSASKEIKNSGIFRDRLRVGGAASPLGDSPNNGPHYFKPTNTVYIGANDGMLHAFNTANGQELFAYIPSALIPKLPELATPNYEHAWYVDGEIAVGTVRGIASGATTHMLVGALGRGGKGLFGLDVTKPADFSANNAVWELNGTPSGQCGADSDHDNLGLILGKPFIGTFNDGKTYALVGNGYNSCTGKAALYIIDIQTGRVVRRIDTPIAGNNGLSTPAALDANGDGKIDLVWAGDLLGNLWRFDLRSSSPANWGVRFGSSDGTPMFTARNSKGEAQPITAPPVATLHGSDTGASATPFVFFGTGRYLTRDDRGDQSVQSWYGLIDDSGAAGGQSTITRGQLTQREFVSAGSATLSNGQQTTTRNIQKQDDGDMVGKRGWFIDFDFKGDEGERVAGAPLLVKVQRGAVITIPSIIPDSDPCMAGGRGYLNFVSAFSGGAVDFPFIDLNGDGIVNEQDILSDSKGVTGSLDLQTGMPGNIIQVGNQLVVGGTGGESGVGLPSGSGLAYHGRVSWREIVHDE
jgi:type IV pilus assembly protein PilY1